MTSISNGGASIQPDRLHADSIQTVGVIGAGGLGTGIAQVCALAGLKTVLVDSDPAAGERARETIQGALHRAVERGRLSAGDRDRALASLELGTLSDLAGVDLAIEAIDEDFEAKTALFRELARIAPAARLATNTASLSISQLGRAAGRPDLAGVRFFNPVARVALLEVICPDAAWGALEGFATRLGKVAIRAGDSPGFIVNRCAQPFYLEAGRMLEAGLADAPILDGCLSTALGAPMGPFELIDLAGTDVHAAASQRVYQAMGRPARLTPARRVAWLAEQGKLGRRSGEGFYSHPRAEPAKPEAVNDVGPFMELLAHVCPVATSDGRTASERAGSSGLALLDVAPAPFMERPTLAYAAAGLDAQTKRELHKTAGHEGVELVEVPDTPGLIALRTVSQIVNEARFAESEGVASFDDIDRALQLGLNWAVGPKRITQWFGASIARTLHALEAQDGRGVYSPAPGAA